MSTPTLDDLRTMLATDGFGLEIDAQPERTNVEIVTVSDDACADCIVPESIMRMYLEPALGVTGDALHIKYPEDSAAAPTTAD